MFRQITIDSGTITLFLLFPGLSVESENEKRQEHHIPPAAGLDSRPHFHEGMLLRE